MRLIVTHGPNLGHEYIVPGGEITIGRSTSNAIVLPSPEISRKHARLWRQGESIYLEDLGSTNGTFVNQTRLSGPVHLYDGDEIQIGDSFRLMVASPGGLTRPISLGSEADAPSAQEAHSPPELYAAEAASEIPTPKPPLYVGLDDLESGADQQADDPQRRFLRWLGCAGLLLAAACLMAAIFLDWYKGGQLLYCGSLNPFFQVVLGPFGFNPICP